MTAVDVVNVRKFEGLISLLMDRKCRGDDSIMRLARRVQRREADVSALLLIEGIT
jgi:hypothetical protein